MVKSPASSTPAERSRVNRGDSPAPHASPTSLNALSHSLSAPKGRWPSGAPTSASGRRYSSVAVPAQRPHTSPPPSPRPGKTPVPPTGLADLKPTPPHRPPPPLDNTPTGPPHGPAAHRARTE